MRRLFVPGVIITFLLFSINAYSQQDYQEFIHRNKQKESFFQQLLDWFQTPFDGSYAIIIGVGNYEYLPRLEAVKNDVDKMKDFLLSTGEYNEVVVLQDEEASFSTIDYFMREYFPQKMKKGRYRFLFYFSGHGTQHREGREQPIGSFLLKEATGELADQNAIDMRTVQLWSDRLINASHTLFLIDACFSGLAGSEVRSYNTEANPKFIAKENGRYLITAGGGNEKSIADLKRWGGSLFTDVLIHGMRGDADAHYGKNEKDGVVTTYELFSYIQAAVTNESNHLQNPLLSQLGVPYKDNGQYFFVYKKPIVEQFQENETTNGGQKTKSGNITKKAIPIVLGGGAVVGIIGVALNNGENESTSWPFTGRFIREYIDYNDDVGEFKYTYTFNLTQHDQSSVTGTLETSCEFYDCCTAQFTVPDVTGTVDGTQGVFGWGGGSGDCRGSNDCYRYINDYGTVDRTVELINNGQTLQIWGLGDYNRQ